MRATKLRHAPTELPAATNARPARAMSKTTTPRVTAPLATAAMPRAVTTATAKPNSVDAAPVSHERRMNGSLGGVGNTLSC